MDHAEWPPARVADAPGSGRSSIEVGADPTSGVYDAKSGAVYIANSNSSNISLIEGRRVIGVVDVTGEPTAMTYNPDLGLVYVLTSDDLVSVLDGTRFIANLTVGSVPIAAAFDPQDALVYVANYYSASVSIIEGSTVIATLPVGKNPLAAAYDPENGYVYVPAITSNNVSVINGTQLVTSIPVGRQPGPPVYDPADGSMYVPDFGGSSVTVLDGTAVVATVPVGAGPNQGGYDPVDGAVYFPNEGSANVSVLEGTRPRSAVAVGDSPVSAAYDAGDGDLFVPNFRSNNVSVLNGTSVVASLDVGGNPDGAVYDPSDGYVYVANSASGNVSVIPTWSRVNFREVGLPPGSAWTVHISGETLTTVNSSQSVALPDGNHSYSIDPFGLYQAEPGAGYVHLTGSDTNVSITFVVYPPIELSGSISPTRICTEASTDCPAGVGEARVNLSAVVPGNGSEVVEEGSNRPIFQFVPFQDLPYAEVEIVPDQTISYECEGPGGAPFDSCAGPIRTESASGVTALEWNWSDTPATNRLYGGDTWGASFLVYVTGTALGTVPVDECDTTICQGGGHWPKNGEPSDAEVEIPETGGSYAASFPPLLVHVLPVSTYYPVTYVQTGLPDGTRWSVTLNGTVNASTGRAIGFLETDGLDYPYQVATVDGFSVEPSSGVVTVNGTGLTEFIDFTASPGPLGARAWGNVTYEGGAGNRCVDDSGKFSSGPWWENVTFGVVAWDGTAPYNYTWNFGDGTSDAFEAAPDHTYWGLGAWQANVTVRDAGAATNSTPIEVVDVHPGGAPILNCPTHPSRSTLLGLPTTVAYALLGGLVVTGGGAAAGVVLWRRRTKARRAPE